MINTEYPDYTNSPAAEARPSYSYLPRDITAPYVSIITPFYNTPPGIFRQTVRSVLRMSLANWEWIIIDDQSSDEVSLAALREVEASDPRIRVIRQPNGGPAVARNHAAREARGKYLLQVDSDDLMEPTFVEKAVWFLETQPQFAAANSFNVTFGTKELLWPNGFHEYEASIGDNRMTMEAVIRKDAYFQAGGYDESISYEHADWDFWLNMAEAGLWGFTLPEYLTWYRTQDKSLMTEIEGDRARAQRFRDWLQVKHAGLRGRFPHPVWTPGRDIPHASVREEIPVTNALDKPEGVKRVLFLVPWFEMGGSDKFNADVVRLLTQRGYEFTLVSTSSAQHAWLSEFTNLTPDVFCLEKFLSYADYPRFLNYLIASRQIDAVLMSNSQLAYLLAPYLRATHPNLPILDYNHMETEDWQDGGYPQHAVRLGALLDLNVVNTQHLKDWMVRRGGNSDQIDVCYCDCDTAQWTPDTASRAATRAEQQVAADTPVILFAGRVVSQKRPLLFVDILQRLAAVEPDFVALVAGSGEQLDAMRARTRIAGLQQRVRFLGGVSSERMRDLMRAADILLLPSDHEGLALVLFEAMAVETVPVGADVGGQRELVTPDCGYLIARGDGEVERYVAVLAELIRDPERRAEMAARGRERVVEHFDMRLMAGGMERAITHATERAAVRQPTELALPLARESAHVAIEYIRMEEVTNMLWNERGKLPQVRLIRALRERVLPIGSPRYEVYKKFRQGLRRLKRAPAALRRRLARRAAGEKPPTPAAVHSAVTRAAAVHERPVALEPEPGLEPEPIAVPALVASDPIGLYAGNGSTGVHGEQRNALMSIPRLDAAGNGRHRMTADTNYQVWERELPAEIAFWQYWITDPDIPWKEERASRLASDTPLQQWVCDLLAAPPGATVRLLDVGAGPATQLGKIWPERDVRITAIDPLADDYNDLLDAARIIPPARTRLGHGEKLTERFAPNTFDLAVAINALDHSYDPVKVIQGMLEVVKPGAWVWLTHYVNEAEQEQYQGLHQWNFCLEDEQFVIWNKHDRIMVAEHLPLAAEIKCWVTFGRVEKGGLRVQIRKRG